MSSPSPVVVYIAGPYRDESAWGVEGNIRKAETLALRLWATRQVVPVCPHAMTRYYYREIDDQVFADGLLQLMDRCDAVLLLPGWRGSSGSVLEVQAALKWQIPVFESEEDLLCWVDEQQGIED